MEKSSLKICQDFKYLYNQQVICLFCIHYLEKNPVAEGAFSVPLFLSVFPINFPFLFTICLTLRI